MSGDELLDLHARTQTHTHTYIILNILLFVSPYSSSFSFFPLLLPVGSKTLALFPPPHFNPPFHSPFLFLNIKPKTYINLILRPLHFPPPSRNRKITQKTHTYDLPTFKDTTIEHAKNKIKRSRIKVTKLSGGRGCTRMPSPKSIFHALPIMKQERVTSR